MLKCHRITALDSTPFLLTTRDDKEVNFNLFDISEIAMRHKQREQQQKRRVTRI